MILRLCEAGVDVFRINMSHTDHATLASYVQTIRSVEGVLERPIGILADLQGPKLRIGAIAGGGVDLAAGATVRLDLEPVPGDTTHLCLPHREVFAVLKPNSQLLIDDGRVRLRITEAGPESAAARVEVGGHLTDRKGVNVPGVVLPIAALSAKDRADLDHALALQVDWIALSFVQRPEDVAEARQIVAGRAGILAKLEKPAAIDRLDAIIELSDALMVARGDLGVELPLEQVPGRQKQIIRAARRAGQARRGGHPDARVHDYECNANAGGSVRRSNCRVRRRRCRHAVGRIGSRRVPCRGGRDDGPDRLLRRK